MISVKAVVFMHHMRNDGTLIVKIRVTYDCASAYFQTPYKVTKYQIDGKGNIKDKTVDRQVRADISRTETEIAAKYSRLSGCNVKEIAEYLFNFLYHHSGSGIQYVPFAKTLISEKEQQGGGNYSMYKYTLSRLTQYVGSEDFSFDDINVRFLDGFDRWLMDEGVGERGRLNYLANVRATMNEAKYRYNDEDRGDIKIPGNPFSKFRMPKPGLPRERALSVEQLKKIINYVPDTEGKQLGKDVFLLSFYLVGMNTVDLYNCEDYKNGRIRYRRTKTFRRRQDHAEISIRVEPEAQELVKTYRGTEKVFNFYKSYKSYQNFNASINRYLGQIGKDLEIDNLVFYCARHTWSSILVNQCHQAESEDAFCLNHVSQYRVTSGYIKKDFSRIDRCNRLVIDYLKKTE